MSKYYEYNKVEAAEKLILDEYKNLMILKPILIHKLTSTIIDTAGNTNLTPIMMMAYVITLIRHQEYDSE